MVDNKNLNIQIENFRAIKKANINIDGITVLAGENGSGKSTISKLTYYLFRTFSNYDKIISDNFNKELMNTYYLLDIFIKDIFSNKEYKLSRITLIDELHGIRTETDELNLKDHLSKLSDFIEKLKYIIKSSSIDEDSGRHIDKLIYIFDDSLGSKESVDEFDGIKENEFTATKLLDMLMVRHDNLFKTASGYKRSRSTKIFRNEFINVFDDINLPKKFIVSEFGSEIFNLNKNYLTSPYLVQNVIYIDTPMMLGIYDHNNRHWNELNEEIKKKSINKDSSSKIFTKISKEIIKGEAVLEDHLFYDDKFIYKREDGKEFNLLNCATGIKSFSILQLLINNHIVNDKTLLIIDEPESHLHPQWIIEYARLIVLLNKIIGVRFLIASHNPDMVSAIKLICEKEKTNQNLNYYLAENKIDEFSYEFIDLKDDIEPIFESFNIAFERMNSYGA